MGDEDEDPPDQRDAVEDVYCIAAVSTYPRIHVYYRGDLRTELTALHTPWVCQNLIRFCMVFDGRQRASAAPSCNDRRA